jgi:hypothetical protein
LADAAEKHQRTRDDGENATEYRQVFGLRIYWLIKERNNTPPPGDDFPSFSYFLFIRNKNQTVSVTAEAAIALISPYRCAPVPDSHRIPF